MRFDLTDEHRATQATMRAFCEKEVAPHVAEWDREHYFPRDLIREMGRHGFFGSTFPEAVGGTNMGFLAHALLCEEASRTWSSLRALFNMQALTVARTVLDFGSPEQIETYVPKWISGEQLGCFALTEPNHGSDVAGMETTAREDGGAWLLNGSKTWITHASVFDAGLVFAKTDPSQRHGGISAFIITPDLPGLHRSEIRDKLGHHGSPTGTLTFNDCRVPKNRLLGTIGHGFSIAMHALDHGRLSVAAGGLGVAQACLDASVRYANERVQFGRPIGAFQMVQQKIADMAASVEAARLLVYRSGYLKDEGRRDSYEVTLAKYVAAEAAVQAANDALEIHGGNGYSEEFPVARLYRDAKMYQIGEGAANITRILIAKHVLG